MSPPGSCALRRAFLAALASLGVLAPARSAAQEAELWNTPEALALIVRARADRQATAVDPEHRSYQALATGHVFFLVDRPSTDQRTLVKADQIAIEVYWKAPRSTRQRIVGMRDEKVLPTNIRYHLDHLTVVQDDFGDVIRIGDGDEVSTVLHPAAPSSDATYDFALGDSLSIAFAGGGEVHVQEVRVRPKALDKPGYVGSLFVDRSSGAIVRMTFTFTPASYVDSYLDYIRISLDNSLWENRWWLPYKQEIEIRRELPQLDFAVGSVIRGRFDIGDYQLNPDLSDALFAGARVTAAPESERRAYAFTEPLVPPAASADLTPTPSLQEIRKEAVRLTAGRYLSGVSRFRPYLPSASEVTRWNRGEGTYLGLGATWRPSGRVALRGTGGWAFGRGEPSASLTVTDGEGRAGVRGTWNQLHDLGPFPGEVGAVNTVSALLFDDDWTDPWFSSGAEVFIDARPGAASLGVRLLAEHQEPAELVVDADQADDFRPILPVDRGWLIALEGSRESTLPHALTLSATARIGLFARSRTPSSSPVGENESFGRLVGALSWERASSDHPVKLLARLDGGADVGDPPLQELFYLGGRGTIPGHLFRAQRGDAFWLASAEASRAIFSPWVTGRVFGSAGATHSMPEGPDVLFPDLPVGYDPGIRTSVGAGVGLLWDVVHVDLARGLDGGEWELVVSVDRRFRGWL